MYTAFRLSFPPSLNLGLRLAEQGYFHVFGKLFQLQDVVIGADEFDRRVVVKAEHGAGVRAPERSLCKARTEVEFVQKGEDVSRNAFGVRRIKAAIMTENAGFVAKRMRFFGKLETIAPRMGKRCLHKHTSCCVAHLERRRRISILNRSGKYGNGKAFRIAALRRENHRGGPMHFELRRTIRCFYAWRPASQSLAERRGPSEELACQS